MPAFVIGFAIMSYLLATDIFTPSMPDIGHYFQAPDNEVQKTISYFLLGAVITCILAGIFADQVGKKKFLKVSLGLAVLGSIVIMTATSLEWLIIGRFIQGLGGGAAPVIGYAIIQELYAKEQQTKIYAMLGIYIAIIPAVAPLLGGIISTNFGWHYIFYILTILFIISIASIWWVLPASVDQRQQHSVGKIIRSYGTILSSRAFLSLALICPLYNAVEWFYLTFLPFYMQERIGMSAEFYGFIIGVLICWFAIGSFISTWLVKRYDVHRTIQIGLAAGIVSSSLLWLTTTFMPFSTWGILASLSVFILGFGMLYPTTVGRSLDVFTESRTRASSVRSLFITSLAFLGSYTAELMDDSHLIGLTIFVSACSLASLAVYHMRPKDL